MLRRHAPGLRGDLTRHADRIAYYGNGLLRPLVPLALHRRRTGQLLRQPTDPAEAAEIARRVDHYIRLDTPFDASDAPRISDIDRGKSRYFIDLDEHARGFGPDRRLHTLFGDITHVPDRPTIVKSRPIGGQNANSVLLNLDKLRHYRLVADPTPFRAKAPAAVWRGSAHTETRRALVRAFYHHPRFDIGHISGRVDDLPPKPRLSQTAQMANRYFVSIEGNDVATSLKWSMASNMLVMSPALRFETWFMEGRLEPGRHFVLLRDDLADLEEKVAHYDAHPAEAEAIIAEAHRWIDRFADPRKERLIAARVLERYFVLSGQMEASPGAA
jgi:hypothetical protein